jgi:hypothetical protein
VFLKIFYFVCLCKYYFLCFVCFVFLFLCKKKKKKKKPLCKCCKFFLFFWFALYVRTYACTFERVLGTAFDLALVSSTAAPFTRTLHCTYAFELTYVSSNAWFTHTLMHPARVRSNVPMYVRMYSVLGLA